MPKIHPQSVARIAELEAPRPVPEEPAEPEKQSPQIVKQLTVTAQGEGGPAETQALHFDAQYTPTDDSTVKIEWFLNEQPLFNSNRHHLTNDFGYAALDINFLLAEDAGDYTLVVSNAVGQAQTSASVQIEGGALILEDTQHPESFRRIQELEAIRPAEPEEPELMPEAPQFTQELTGLVDSLAEGMPLHLDATVMPITDPKLRIEWFFNRQPLQFSRIRTIHDFGYVALEFAHLLPSDSGTYTCRATNEIGEAESSITIDCETKRNLYLDSQHEQSWQKIQEIEGRQLLKEPSPELHFLPPTFIVPLSNFEDLIEGDVVRLECRLQPVNDPTLKVYWTCNEQPLPEGNRFMPARNLDLVTLDILTVYGEDSGLYSCRAVSDFGEAQTSATVKCQPTDALMLDTQHEQSWQQIQEIENRQPPEFIVPEPEIVAPRFVVPIASGQSEFQAHDSGTYIVVATNEQGEARAEGSLTVRQVKRPIADPRLRLQWFHNGRPLTMSNRISMRNDFGLVTLDEGGEASTEGRLEVTENSVVLFEARVMPINDPGLKLQWYRNDQPLLQSNRYQIGEEFGHVWLRIVGAGLQNVVTYTCKAVNKELEAIDKNPQPAFPEMKFGKPTARDNDLSGELDVFEKRPFIDESKRCNMQGMSTITFYMIGGDERLVDLKPFVKIVVNEISFWAMLDTGASLSMCSINFQKCATTTLMSNLGLMVKGIGNELTPAEGRSRITFQLIGDVNKKSTWMFYVIRTKIDAIIGLDYMKNEQLIIDLQKDILIFSRTGASFPIVYFVPPTE